MRLRHAATGALLGVSAALSVWLSPLLSPSAHAEPRAAVSPDAAAPPADTSSKDSPAGANPLFDPARYIRVSEVKIGMKGYGLSVFKGTKIERFDVEVAAILHNFNPKCDVVLINCHGANLEHTGAIAGMSGSPIYLKDEQGRERMLGAFAYGWPLTKDPVAGVQPIEYMLTLPVDRPRPVAGDGGATTAPSGTSAGAGEGSGHHAAEGNAAWTWHDAAVGWNRLAHPTNTESTASLARSGTTGLTGNGDVPALRPLATPLMASGLSPRLLDQLGPAFRAAGLVPMQGGSAGSAAPTAPAAPLEPGSVLAVPLLTGDTDMTAIGTCTEVRGDRVYGFGHAFNNEGAIDLPMGSGYISAVIATLTTSFKLGSLTQPRGALLADQTVGVGGRTGALPPTVPIEIKVTDAAGRERIYHFNGAVHPRFTPLICNAAFAAAVSGVSELPQFNTVDYALDLEFANGRSIRVEDTAVNTTAPELFQGIGMAMVAASDNPFARVLVRKLSGTVKVSSHVRQGQILDVNVPRSKYRPGETIKGFVTYKPFRADEAIMPIELDLPKDIGEGQYQLVISDADRYVQDEQATKPFRFTAEKGSDVFDVLKYVAGIRHNALYVRLIRQPDGVAIGRVALPQLPSSRRQILLGAGRSNTTPFVSSTVKIIPTDRVMAGSAEFQIQIETRSKDTATGRGPSSRPSTGAPKAEEPKPAKTGGLETPAKEPKPPEPAPGK